MSAAVYDEDAPFGPVVASRRDAARAVASLAVNGHIPIEVTTDGVRMRDDLVTPTVLPTTTSTPPRSASGNAPTLEALVAAAGRSTSKRTQALGLRLADLADVMRGRLAEERKAAERAEREKAEQAAARAEVERLEAQLAAARAKAGVSRRRQASGPVSDAQKAALAALHSPVDCRKCGRTCGSAAGRGAHERRCTGSAS